MSGSLRLDRLLAREGFGTRSEVRKQIRAGKAAVNGVVEKDPGRQVQPCDEVVLDGHPVGTGSCVYYMLHKPAGVVTATRDPRARTVMDLLRAPQQPVLRRGLFPVGRLDRDTEGLLLITDDGALAHKLLSPARHVDKTYYAVVTGRVTEEDIRRFAEGLRVGGPDSPDGFTALPALLRVCPPGSSVNAGAAAADPLTACLQTPEAEDPGVVAPGVEAPEAEDPGVEAPGGEDPGVVDPGVEAALSRGVTEYTQVCVTIREGKYHQIRRMFRAVGKEVLYLKRLSMGPLVLDPGLAPGRFRALTDGEIQALRTAGQ